ncbi:MAG: helix-turn-helix transcriptional regulator [Frankia sp.]
MPTRRLTHASSATSGGGAPSTPVRRARASDRSTAVRDAPDQLWTVAELAAYLRVPTNTIYKWRHLGEGPKGFRIGRHVRFDPADVITWLESRREVSSGD